MKHTLALAIIIAFVACRHRAEPTPVADAGLQCVYPAPRDVACLHDSDCYDVSPCTADRCIAGRCSYNDLPDGTGCDVTPTTDTCRSGACCPFVQVFEGPR